MTIYGAWICYNNCQTIGHSINSVYKYIDELVVIDGSFDGKTSDDGTWEIVEAFRRQGKPLHHVKSKGTTLYEKHNEHVVITGNRDPNVWTWQVDSDEIYLEKHAKIFHQGIVRNQNNGLAVKLININRIEKGVAYTDESIKLLDTYQMRIYRMHKGINFKTRDNIFEWIVYGEDEPVQTQANKIAYIPMDVAHAFNYHCMESMEQTVGRYRHYKTKNPEEFAAHVRSAEKNTWAISDHPLKHIWRA